jgi:F0F1-type ATP synthase assembly protein I
MRARCAKRGEEGTRSRQEVNDMKAGNNGRPEESGAAARADRETRDTMRAYGTLGSVGLSFVLAIVLGAGGGLLIDRWIGSGHWGFFIGFFLGLAAGIFNVVRASKSIK